MKKLIPVLTEKSMTDAEKGVYTFYVDRSMTKHQTKLAVGSTFGVVVKTVRTITVPGQRKRLNSGRYKEIKSKKKVMITLADNQKIDIFMTKKK